MRSSLGTEEDIHSSHDTHFRLSVRREGTCLAGVREKKRVLVTGTLGKSALATDQAREASQADRESNPSFFLGQVAVKVNLSHTVLSCRTHVLVQALFVPVFGASGLEETYFPGDGTLVPVARLIRETKPVVQLREAENTGTEFSSSRQ